MATKSISSTRLLGFSHQIYTLLLFAYPPRFRVEYGPHMTQAFRDCCREAYRHRSALGIVWFWVSTISDLAVTVVHEWFAKGPGPAHYIQKVGIGLAAGMAGGMVAGVGARVAMRGVSLAGGLTPGFTPEGTFAILVIGLVMGIPFGIGFMLVRSLVPGEGLWKGLTYGLLLFVVFVAPPFLFYREGEALLATPLVTVGLFGPVALAYGLAVQFTALRLERRSAGAQADVAAGSSSRLTQIVWLAIFATLLQLAVLGTGSILNHYPRIPMTIARSLPAFNIPFTLVRDANIWLITLFALGYFGTSALIFWSRHRWPMARFSAIALMLFGGALFNTGAGYYAALMHNTTLLESLFGILQAAGATCLLGLLYTFPDGRLAVRWTRPLAVLWLVWAIGWIATSGLWPESVSLTILTCFFVTGVAAQVQRYRRIAALEERQRSRPVVIGIFGAVAGFAIVTALLLLIPDLRLPKVTGPSITAGFSLYLLPWLLIPVTIGWAMRRRGLWAI